MIQGVSRTIGKTYDKQTEKGLKSMQAQTCNFPDLSQCCQLPPSFVINATSSKSLGFYVIKERKQGRKIAELLTILLMCHELHALGTTTQNVE